MPTFCRHNRLLQRCPICTGEQQQELPRSPSRPRARGLPKQVKIGRVARAEDDGYRSELVPGLKSSADAARLAQELAFATERLSRLAEKPPGLYAEVADRSLDVEERTWLAFLIAYLCPLEADDPFASVRETRTPWASGAQPELGTIATGPRTAHDLARGAGTLEAYRAWASRAGSQRAAFHGDGAWSPERRFARIYERLALPGFHRDARFELLVSLGSLGVYELRAGALQLGAHDEVTTAAKRALGIGDPLLLERRAAELARACEVPLEALDLGLYNWGRGERVYLGVPQADVREPAVVASARAALGV